MEIRDPKPNSILGSNSSPNLNPPPYHAHIANTNLNAGTSISPSPPTITAAASPQSIFSGSGPLHRRAHSEVSFRIPEDMSIIVMNLSPSGPANGGGGGGSSTASLEEIGSEDDLFFTYIDVEKVNGDNGSTGGSGTGGNFSSGNCTDQTVGGGEGEKKPQSTSRSRHRHGNSVDGSAYDEIMEAKKAMPPDKLAELWSIDPKRAKRILANRQSAARSKERKARYILELERKVQTLQTEATTLSAQLTLFQRDTMGLSSENTELKLRLQAMEQQAKLRDALNEALKKEVERLKIVTGEITSPAESFDLGMHQISYAPSFLPISQQPGPSDHQNMPMAPFNHSQWA
ncbi:bZIP transcription factor 18-like isoform X2 [Tripterygium wilfordii]|uniref:bZIP transcription factor 18-like isoform X2 n=1 Tax=Tripterygium wilfordii TaxID=458696 RepID=UPI0018F83763|nr:bZIP transcription factor 18-like isoform X2 [Tripterygium wilfordii]